VHVQVEAVIARKGARSQPATVDLAHLLAKQSGDDDTTYNAPTSVYDSPMHYLHGVLHKNGYGHLVRLWAGAVEACVSGSPPAREPGCCTRTAGHQAAQLLDAPIPKAFTVVHQCDASSACPPPGKKVCTTGVRTPLFPYFVKPVEHECTPAHTNTLTHVHAYLRTQTHTCAHFFT